MTEATKPTTPTLPKAVFAVDVPNHELLKLAYDAFLANNRLASANTKTRGEVRGGGRKPWKQKGTGRARFGSTRNPIWRGGGIVFGPRGNENYTKRVSKNAKRVAIKQALTLANKDKKILVADVKTTGKTSDIVKFLDTNKLNGKVLLVVADKTPEIIRATNNLQAVLLVKANYLNVYHLLNADHVVLAKATLPILESWLTKEEA